MNEKALEEAEYLIEQLNQHNDRNINYTALSAPTFEDAIKVVEDFKMEMVKANITENTPIPDGLTVVNDVLTALRERVEGK